jgi:hypothetical protein
MEIPGQCADKGGVIESDIGAFFGKQSTEHAALKLPTLSLLSDKSGLLRAPCYRDKKRHHHRQELP